MPKDTRNKTVTLPAVEVEIPRMGIVVYVSPRIGTQDGKPTAMFVAEIAVKGNIELQAFHLKCKTEVEAKKTSSGMLKQLQKTGPYPFIQHGIN